MKTVIRVTIEEVNPETKEVVETLISEEKDGLYNGVCLMGNLEKNAQVFIHHLTGADLCTFIHGSEPLTTAARIATMLDSFGGIGGKKNDAN